MGYFKDIEEKKKIYTDHKMPTAYLGGKEVAVSSALETDFYHNPAEYPRLYRRWDECVFNEKRCTAWQTGHTDTACTPIRNRQNRS